MPVQLIQVLPAHADVAQHNIRMEAVVQIVVYLVVAYQTSHLAHTTFAMPKQTAFVIATVQHRILRIQKQYPAQSPRRAQAHVR